MGQLKTFLGEELNKGIFTLFVTMNLFNLLNLIFHFSMGRMLGPTDYGILVALLALVEIYSIPSEVIGNVITKYTSQLKAHEEEGKIKYLLSKSLRWAILLSVTFFIILTVAGFFLSSFLRINFWLILITNLLVFSLLLNPIVKGILQGRKKFAKLGACFLFEGVIKLFVAIALVILGFKVSGAIGGIIAGAFGGLILTFYFNKEVLVKQTEKIKFEKIKFDWIPYFVVTVAILLVMNLDVIFSRRFFSDVQSGNYAVLSTLGKMLFIGTIAISKVLFPISANENTLGKNTSKHLFKSILIFALIAIAATGFLSIFSRQLILFLYGPQYLETSNLLVYSCIALSFLALSNLILIYELSINHIKYGVALFILPLLEVAIFYFFHSTISQYILAFMFFNIGMFIFIGLSFIVWKRKKYV